MRQRYVKKVTVESYKTKTKPRATRFNFFGEKENVQEAKRKVEELGLVPKEPFVTAPAFSFVRNPKRYGVSGEWTEQGENDSP